MAKRWTKRRTFTGQRTMAKFAEVPLELDEQSTTEAVRPVRMRRSKRNRSSGRSRQRQTKRKGNPGGIHLRANKRIACESPQFEAFQQRVDPLTLLHISS
jgi:hypothetical protein